jgi:hypothetical protein
VHAEQRNLRSYHPVDQTIRNMITSDGPLVTLTGKETYIQYPLDKFTSFHNTLRSHNCIQHLEAIDPNELDGQMWEEQGESTSFFLQAHYQEVSFFRIRFGFWVLRLLFWFLCYSILWCASQLSPVSHICPNPEMFSSLKTSQKLKKKQA